MCLRGFYICRYLSMKIAPRISGELIYSSTSRHFERNRAYRIWRGFHSLRLAKDSHCRLSLWSFAYVLFSAHWIH